MVAAVLATAIVLGWIDYWIRFRDRGVLVVFAASVLGVLGWTLYSAVRRLLFFKARLGDTELALHVEACYPAVKHLLASALEFLRQPEDDTVAGSAVMRRAAISQAVAASKDLDFGAVLDRRPALRAALAALLVGGLAAYLTLANPAAAHTALARLAFPLGTADWPQRTHLGLRQPVKPVVIVRGRPLEVEVIDTRDAPLPPDCRIHYRLRDAQGRMREESEPMQSLGKAMAARRESVTLPLEFRCTGGDDEGMRWTEVQVIDPPETPAVRALTLKITPPRYTNWPDEDREATSQRPILAGSRVQFSGTASKRLKPTSKLRLDDGRNFSLAIEGDGTTFHVGEASARGSAPGPQEWQAPHEFVVEKSTGYTFRLVDVDGVKGGGDESWQLRVLADAPPSVVIEQPAGDLFVTQRAIVSFRVRARDDVAVRQISLLLRSSDAKAMRRSDEKALNERTILLFAGPEKPRPTVPAAFELGAACEPLTIDRSIDLSDFPLFPGMQMTCMAAVSDYRSQISRSDPRVLTVITADQLLERMAVRQSQILAELARALQLQRDTRGQVRMLEIRLRESGSLEQADIDRLQAAEFNQREIVRSLTSRTDGLPAAVSGLLADLEGNRLDNPELNRRLERLLVEFDRASRDHFSPIGMELTAAIKGSQVRLQSLPRPAGRDTESQSHLASAGEHQEQVIASLEGMLAGMRQWDDYRRFHREAAQLLRDQEDVARETTAKGRVTVGRDPKELSSQESAELKILAEHQFELARRETRLEQEMEQTAAAQGQSEPLTAATLIDAVAEARRMAIAADMSTAGGKIRDNGIGLVPADHQRILENLQGVLDILANNRQQELGLLVKKLGEVEADLNALGKEQEALRREIDEIAGPPGSRVPDLGKQKAELENVAHRQEELRPRAQQLARRLARLSADRVADTVGKAAEQMEQGRRAGDGGDYQEASRGAKDAETALKDASRQLREKLFETEAQLAMAEQVRLQEAIKHLQQQEERILAETRGFADLERSGGLDRVQDRGLLELAQQQGLLRDEAARVMQSLGPANVFRMALATAVDAMGRASALLDQQKAGVATQGAEQYAIDRLKLILTAMEPEEPAKTETGEKSIEATNGGDRGHQGGNPSNGERTGVLPLAQLKLLKFLQEDLNGRTQQLNRAEAAGRPIEELREQYTRLSEEQGRLAELTFQLLRPQPPRGGEPMNRLNEATEPKEKGP